MNFCSATTGPWHAYGYDQKFPLWADRRLSRDLYSITIERYATAKPWRSIPEFDLKIPLVTI